MIEIAIAIIGLAAAILAVALQERSKRAEGLRRQFGEALADVHKWEELVYRIARRSAGDLGRQELTHRINDLQERLRHNISWIRVESESVHATYECLVRATKTSCQAPLQAAWKREPPVVDELMNLGELVATNNEKEIDAFVDSVRRHLRLYVVRLWA